MTVVNPNLCRTKAGVTNKESPVDLWSSISACIKADRFDDAIYLYAVAGSFGQYDVQRVSDATAHGVVKALPILSQGALPQDKVAEFQKHVRETLGNDQTRAAVCTEIEALGPPDYVPSYMVGHGMAAFQTSGSHLVQLHDTKKAWSCAVNQYLSCPGRGSSLKCESPIVEERVEPPDPGGLMQKALLERRAIEGDAEAMYQIGELYCGSNGSVRLRDTKHWENCFRWTLRAAEKGHAKAQCKLGFSYVDGRYGNEKSGVEMVKWMKRAADQGGACGYFYVGMAYAGVSHVFGSMPTGVEKDPNLAEYWLKKSAVETQQMGPVLELAEMYFKGDFLKQDIAQAAHWYKVAAGLRHHPYERKRLAEIYEKGIGVPPDPTEARRWRELAEHEERVPSPVEPVN